MKTGFEVGFITIKAVMIAITALSTLTIISLIASLFTHGRFGLLMFSTNLIAITLLVFAVFQKEEVLKKNKGWLIAATATTSIWPLAFLIAILTPFL